MVLETAHSIRFLYKHFLSGITKKLLNVFYYACSYAKVNYSKFINITAKTALKLIPDSLKAFPVFLCVDDTMVSKSGTRFENVSKLFDHAAHTGRRGRPAKHGKRLSVENDFTFSNEKTGSYYTGVRRVITKIFGCREVLAYVTVTSKENGTKRLFFSTIFLEKLRVQCAFEEKNAFN